MTIDPFVLLAPVLLLAVVALLRFVGCNWVFGIHDTTPVTPTPITFRQLAENYETLNNKQVDTRLFPNDVVAGNLMVVWIWYNSSMQSVSMVTDSASNHYDPAVGPTAGVNTLADWKQEIWYAKGINGGANFTVTATFTGLFNAEKAISAHEYQGADPTSPLDATQGNQGSTADASSGTALTTAANELIFGAAVFNSNGSPTLDFTQHSSLQSNVTEDKRVTSVGSYAATFKNGPQDWIAQMATFKSRLVASTSVALIVLSLATLTVC